MKFKKYLFNYFLILSLLFLFTVKSLSFEPEKFVESVVNEASQVLTENVTKERKIEKLKSIAKENVDIKGIGFYTLGSHRKNLSDEQKEKYINLFESYFLKSFSSRLSDYTDPKINVIGSNKINEKYTIVSSILVATKKRPEVKIDWRIYTKKKDKPLIRDLIIEGLSLARTLKEEFNSIIQSNDGNINSLFDSLKNFASK